MQDASATKMRTALLVLWGAVGLVLLVGCGNFVNLLMARTAAKRKELAVRVALGASRSRLLTQSLSESVLLSMLGGVLGVLLAQAGLRLIGPLVPSDLVGLKETILNIRVLAFTVAVSLLSELACGLIPLLQILQPMFRAC
jgi:putative ABC transport system permease protein